MTDTERGIALATLDDVSGILDLQDRNLSDSGGSLSVPFSRNWFETAVANAQVIVARSNGRVVGYLVFSTFAAQAHVPLVQAMLKVYPGTPNAYNYGPICVAESERGRGLAGSMFAALRARLGRCVHPPRQHDLTVGSRSPNLRMRALFTSSLLTVGDQLHRT
jgi:hypothetical protein